MGKLQFGSPRVHEALGSLGETFTMIDFLRVYEGKFVSDTGTPIGRSKNVADAKQAADLLREAGCTKVGQKRARDDNGHSTSTSVWSKP